MYTYLCKSLSIFIINYLLFSVSFVQDTYLPPKSMECNQLNIEASLWMDSEQSLKTGEFIIGNKEEKKFLGLILVTFAKNQT